jgi:hypothetical protein
MAHAPTRLPALARGLRANALVSLITGCAGVLMALPLVQTIGLIAGETYQVLGALLLGHMAVLLWAAGRATITFWARLNIAGLVGYVLLLIAAQALGEIATPTGRALVALDAFVVLLLALWQARALKAATPQPAQ